MKLCLNLFPTTTSPLLLLHLLFPSGSSRKPSNRVLVVDGPGRHNRKEGQRGSTESELNSPAEVLGDEADGERDNLWRAAGSAGAPDDRAE